MCNSHNKLRLGVPTSEVGYTAAMPRREDHEVHKDMWRHWTKKKPLRRFEVLIEGLATNSDGKLPANQKTEG